MKIFLYEPNRAIASEMKAGLEIKNPHCEVIEVQGPSVSYSNLSYKETAALWIGCNKPEFTATVVFANWDVNSDTQIILHACEDCLAQTKKMFKKDGTPEYIFVELDGVPPIKKEVSRVNGLPIIIVIKK